MNRLPDDALPSVDGKLLRRALAEARERGEIDWGVSEETYQFWKSGAGNAKARRRWRRRNVPNTQRINALARAVYGGVAPNIQRHRNGDGAPNHLFDMPIKHQLDARPAFGLNGEVLP